MSDSKNIIEYPHERDWRVPGDFNFDIKQATVLVMSTRKFKEFMEELMKLIEK